MRNVLKLCFVTSSYLRIILEPSLNFSTQIMNKRYLLSSLFLASPLLLFAKGNVTGTVVNKATGEPMDFVTIQIVDAKGQPLQVVASTDEAGKFTLPNIADGSYVVKITNIGSIDQERPIKVNGGSVDLGLIRLVDDSKVLQEVVVEGIRSQMRFELDKKVFSVDSNIASAGQSASELLESVPSVEVDQDGEVSLRGDTSVTIWINGKESGLSADNRAQILEQIPAESIDRIEVITNPSAKYSPEGTSGIINIILKKDHRGGYYGSAELSANTRGGGNASVNINYNNSKWDTYASVGFRMRHNNGGSEMRRDFTNGTHTYSDGESRNHGNNLFVRAGATYHLTDKDDFYANAFGMFGRRWGHTNTVFSSTVPGMWNTDLESQHTHSTSQGAHVEWGYSHKWSDNHTLDAMVGYNYWGGPTSDTYAEIQTYADGTKAEEYRDQEMPIHSNSWEAKLDYVNQLTSWLKLEAGYQGNYSHENTPNTTFSGITPTSLTLDEALFNRFIYTNNISALYVTLGGKVKDFSFSAGVRSESWQVRSKSLDFWTKREDGREFKSNNFALFPSVFLSYSLPHDNEVQLNYTRRIRRPWGAQLNSFLNTSDPTNYSYGNEELEPQYSNSFELNYLKSFTWHMISVSAYIRSNDNCMSRISYRNSYDGVIYSTTVNVANRVNSGVEIVSKNSLIHNVLDLTTTLNLYNDHISAWNYTGTAYNPNPQQYPDLKTFSLSGEKQNSFAWDIRAMANAKLPWGLSLQATGRYSSSHREAQGTHQGGWSVDAGLRKVLGNWSFSLNCRDIFDSRKMKNTVFTDEYFQSSKRWRGGRTLSLTVKYSFGNMKSKPNRNTEAPTEIEYDGGEG